MRVIVVFAALVITGVFGQTCEEATCEEKCAKKCKGKEGKPSKCGGSCQFSNECKRGCWCNQSMCEPMKKVGEPCRKNDECIGLSKCVPLGNGICEATCEQKCAKKCKGKEVKPSKCGGKCKFSIECKHGCWCNKSICEPMTKVGEPCRKNDECLGLSKCVPLGNGICEETCRVDNDCLQYENGKNKYCTVGGTAGTQKGKCEMKHVKGYRCARSPECCGKMYCRNGQCQLCEEVVICSLNCHGPDPRKPDHIRPGHIVNITYSCTFIRRCEMGHRNLKATVTLDRTKKLGVVKGESPQYFSGFVTKKARKGEFTASLDAVMTTCVSNKPDCAANRKCILNAGQ